MDDLIEPFRASLPSAPVIVEAGAHNGADTLLLARDAAHVHAFEPVPALYGTLQVVTSNHPNVTAYQLALGRRSRVQKMWISGGSWDGSSSLREPTGHRTLFPAVAFGPEPLDVQTVTLVAWARRNDCRHVDGMWLDMQGGELDALKGAGKLLATVTALVVEVSLVELYDGCPLWPEVREWLKEKGFCVKHETIDSGEPQGNVLLVR